MASQSEVWDAGRRANPYREMCRVPLSGDTRQSGATIGSKGGIATVVTRSGDTVITIGVPL